MKKSFIKLLCLAVAILSCSFIFAGCDEIKDHNIRVTSCDITLGTVSGYGVYKTNYEVTLTASPKSQNSAFIGWLKDGFLVSQETPYTFTASSDTEGKYIAIFNYENMNLYRLTSASVEAYGVTYEETSSETIEKFTDVTIGLGTTTGLYTAMASQKDVYLNGETLNASEFEILPYVVNTESSIYCSVTLTGEYINTNSSNIKEKKYQTQIKIDFSKLSENNNLNIEKITNY